MKQLLGLLLLALPLTGVASENPVTELETAIDGALPAGAIYRNIDRSGSDYRNFDLRREAFQMCEEACELDRRCKAWTYVRAGIQGPKARCWLEWRVPAARYNTCCTSGVK